MRCSQSRSQHNQGQKPLIGGPENVQTNRATSVVVGNPGVVKHLRFDAATISALLVIRWWDWPVETIQANLALITGADIDALRDGAKVIALVRA